MTLPGSRETVILRSGLQRLYAKQLLDAAPDDTVVTFKEMTRTLDQNAKMWAMLADVSKAMPVVDGKVRRHTDNDWKAILMHACGWEVQFLEGLDGRPFPKAFSTSNLTVKQMADLITYIYAFGDEHGVRWSEPNPDHRAAESAP